MRSSVMTGKKFSSFFFSCAMMDFGFFRRRRRFEKVFLGPVYSGLDELLFDVSARKERDTGRCRLISFPSLSIGFFNPLISNIDIYCFGVSIHIGRKNQRPKVFMIGLALHSGNRLATP